MKRNTIKLAIVIPYYKITYFDELLDALSKQTIPKFNIYIGDDDSFHTPNELMKKYENKLNIQYKKFQTNQGGTNLVAQWHRCLNLIKDEEWVWILPDDDIPSLNVVEEFYKGLDFQKKYNIKIMKFPVSIIDENSKIIKDLNFHDPLIENNLDFYERVVRGEAGASLGDNIFHRESLESQGGFVYFPKAWGSDHATLLQVSTGGNIYCLKKAKLYFRMSGENISSDTTDGLIKLDARIMFAKWLKKNEYIFPDRPSHDFYKFFYWKAEYYILNEWKFSIYLFMKLYNLRKICMQSNNFLPIFKVILQKIIK